MKTAVPARFIARAHLRARRLPLAVALLLALLAAATTSAGLLRWWSPTPFLPIALGLASLAVLIHWIRRLRRITAPGLARSLDAEWALSSRLEAAAELANDPSAFAAAQRSDAASRLAGRPEPRSALWNTAIALVVVSILVLLCETGVIAWRLVSTGSIAPVAVVPPAPPDISATLSWRSPKPEIKATAIEEIPLAATADIHVGLKSVTLEIDVNGEARPSRPLDAAILATLSSPGKHPVDLSLYLDELEVREFDLVSYHLRAVRDTAKPAPEITSPLQFIQIRPAREDVVRIQGGPGDDLQKLALLIGNLKAAQVQLLKQNHLLAHDPIDHALPAWRAENTRLADAQKELSQKASESRDFAIAEQMPSLVVDNLGQIQPLMDAAAADIAAAKNDAAARPQGKALALITALERLLQKMIIEGGGSGDKPPPQNHDPFKDQQQFELPPRPRTPAGELEQLAGDQAAAAADPDAEAREFLAKQAEIARRLTALEKAGALDPAAQGKVAEAARSAAEAAAQLEQGDRSAALAPAAAAAQALGEAVAAQEKAGIAAAEATLEDVRRDIAAAERLDDPAARAAALSEAAAKLRAEALAQQQTGSAEAARRLAEAAAKVQAAASGKGEAPGKSSGAPSSAPGQSPGQASSPGGQSPGQSPGSSPSPGQGEGQGKGQGKGQGQGQSSADGSGPDQSGGNASTTSASSAAAQAQAALAPRDRALSRVIRRLQGRTEPSHTTANAASGRGDGGRSIGPGKPQGDAVEMELAAGLASELFATAEDRELARRLAAELHAQPEDATAFGFNSDLRALIDKVVVRLEAARQAGLRDEQVRRFNPDDIDPAYRPAVENYFETLSREAAK